MYWCLLGGTMLWTVAPCARSQTVVETQQQANDRIRALSAKTVAPQQEYIIGRGDLVVVEVYEVPELSREVRVSQTGTIGLPLLPTRIYVAGLTELQLQQKIAEVLEADGLVTSPRVMISVKERRSKPITVVGAVAHPMVYQADRPVTLIQVLAEAGGIAADAGDTVIVTRTQAQQTANPGEPPEIGTEDAVPATDPSAPPANGAATGPDAAANKNAGEQSSPPPSAAGQNDAQSAAQAAQNSTSAQTPSATLPSNTVGANPGAANLGSTGSATPPAISSSDAAPPPLANMITVNLTEILERGETQNNIPLQGGDIVTVPHAGIVYALGAVSRPGGFVANNDRAQLSTLKLLALAGGTTRVAKKGHALIIRKDATGKQMAIPVDLGKIVKQETEDVRLMPSDILYVPDNATKAALLRAVEIGIGVGTSLIIYRVAQ
jgi:protein involved in polysaccharide export with SLBB domain